MRHTLEQIVSALRDDPNIIVLNSYIGPQAPQLLEHNPLLTHPHFEGVDPAALREVASAYAQANGAAIAWAYRAQPPSTEFNPIQDLAALEEEEREIPQEGYWPANFHPEELEQRGLHGQIYMPPLEQVLSDSRAPEGLDDHEDMDVRVSDVLIFDWIAHYYMSGFYVQGDKLSVVSLGDYGVVVEEQESWSQHLARLLASRGTSSRSPFQAPRNRSSRLP